MSEAAVPESVTILAVPEQVRVARAFVAGVLGESHPHVGVALLLASELVTNSVRHSGSAVLGGLVTVTVADPRPFPPICLLCGGAPTIPGFYNENRGRSDDVVFIASCQDTTGIASLAVSRLISGDNQSSYSCIRRPRQWTHSAAFATSPTTWPSC